MTHVTGESPRNLDLNRMFLACSDRYSSGIRTAKLGAASPKFIPQIRSLVLKLCRYVPFYHAEICNSR